MKKYYVLLMFLSMGYSALAQTNPAQEVAARIADRLRDSLSLSAAQRTGIYNINLQLHEQKMSIRRDHASSPDKWAGLMQRVENTRDSLYRTVITSEEIFSRYKAKKAQLVRAN